MCGKYLKQKLHQKMIKNVLFYLRMWTTYFKNAHSNKMKFKNNKIFQFLFECKEKKIN